MVCEKVNKAENSFEKQGVDAILPFIRLRVLEWSFNIFKGQISSENFRKSIILKGIGAIIKDTKTVILEGAGLRPSRSSGCKDCSSVYER